MPAPDSTCARILSALADLLAQESAVLQVQDYSALDRIETEAGALIAFLAGQPPVALVGLEKELLDVQATRQRNARKLQEAMGANRDELRLISARQGLIARVAPAYGTSGSTLRQISLVA